MKTISAMLTLLAFQMCTTKPQTAQATCFTGKLVKSGICGQRVVQLISGPKAGIVLAENWIDSLSNKQYAEVFTVANPCDFPTAIKQDEEFRFSLTTNPGTGCIQCYAYTAVPEQRNSVMIGCDK